MKVKISESETESYLNCHGYNSVDDGISIKCLHDNVGITSILIFLFGVGQKVEETSGNLTKNGLKQCSKLPCNTNFQELTSAKKKHQAAFQHKKGARKKFSRNPIDTFY